MGKITCWIFLFVPTDRNIITTLVLKGKHKDNVNLTTEHTENRIIEILKLRVVENRKKVKNRVW